MVRASLLLALSLLSYLGAHLAFAAPASPTPGAPVVNPTQGNGEDVRSEGQPGCRFERPKVWTSGNISWLGRCRGGFADGSGVLLNVVDGQEAERFYGRLHQGRVNVGVLQTGQGYIAGTWAGGAIVEKLADDMAQRNAIIAAFHAAVDASTSVSKAFAKKGDAKASLFYSKQARSLRDQMD
jgi:hypothetical protein